MIAQKIPDDDPQDKDDLKLLAKIKQEIAFYDTKAGPWQRKIKKIVRRYKDERNNRNDNDNARFNILWSNTELLKPALYAKKPTPNIERRNRIKDDLGRTTATVLERCIGFYINESFDITTRQCVIDLLLPGRGTAWVRYEPKFEMVHPEGQEITDDVETESYEMLSDEQLCWDYVHVDDFGHSWGRVWEEVDIGWRKVYLDKQEIKERFGEEIAAALPLDYSPQDLKDSKVETVTKKSTIYECWHKGKNKVFWLHKDYEEGFLDEKDDPLGLVDFWPFPRPLFATLANDSCIPTPDYIMYQDQAIELDSLTGRIAAIVKSVKVAGVYDASAQGVQRLLSEGVENQLIPVEKWAMLSEKGGLAGVMALMPMEEILKTLLGLYDARDKVKQDIYEITGLSDIIRGASDPNETYGAQRIKSQFGTLRLSARQDEVQRFCRDMVYIGTQIIGKHFSLETIQRISNMTLLTGEEKQMIQITNQYQQQAKKPPVIGQMPPPPPPPLPQNLASIDPEDLQELMDEPIWEEVMQFLQSSPLIDYRIDIETDSTIKLDQESEQNARVEFLKAVGSFISAAQGVQDPAMAPLMAKMLMFGVRGFKVGRDLEESFEETIKKLEKEAANPQPKPNPEMAKVQGQMELEKQKMQNDMHLKQQQMKLDQQKASADSQAEIMRLQAQAQVDTNQGRVDAAVEQAKTNFQGQIDMAIAKMNNEVKVLVAQISAKSQIDQAVLASNDARYAASLNQGETND